MSTRAAPGTRTLGGTSHPPCVTAPLPPPPRSYFCFGLMAGMADGDLPLNDAQFYFTVSIITAGAFIFAFR